MTNLFRTALAGGAAAIAALALAAPTATATSATIIPAPTGGDKVGAMRVQFIDPTRSDAIKGTATRSFMATVWYPSGYEGGGTGMRYASQNFWNDMAIGSTIANGLGSWGMASNISGKYNHASWAGPILAGGVGTLPVVIFSPGFGMPGLTQTAMAQDLASHGYAVITLDHTYEALVVEHPAGLRYQHAAPIDDWYKQAAMSNRIGDLEYVVESLAGLPEGIGPRLDTTNISLIGHSLGAAAALHMAELYTFKSVVMLDGIAGWALADGSVDVPSGLPTPVLSLSTVEGTPGGAGISHPSVQAMLAYPPTGHTMISAEVLGTQHLAFTDVASLTPTADAPTLRGSITADRAHQIVRTFVRGYLDHTMRNAALPAYLAGNTVSYPEVSLYTVS